MCDLRKFSQNLAFDFRRSSLLNLLVEVVLFSEFFIKLLSNHLQKFNLRWKFRKDFLQKKTFLLKLPLLKLSLDFLLPSTVSWSLLIQLTRLNKKFYTGVIVSLQKSKIPFT